MKLMGKGKILRYLLFKEKVISMRGQLSAEMLIIITVILAIVIILATQLIGSAKNTSQGIDNQTGRIDTMTQQASKSPEGGYCFEEVDCQNGLSCERSRCVS
jgi:hypothetical protein